MRVLSQDRAVLQSSCGRSAVRDFRINAPDDAPAAILLPFVYSSRDMDFRSGARRYDMQDAISRWKIRSIKHDDRRGGRESSGNYDARASKYTPSDDDDGCAKATRRRQQRNETNVWREIKHGARRWCLSKLLTVV